MSSQGSTNSIDQLLGSSKTSPNQALSEHEIARIRISASIVRQNFDRLEDFVDGDVDNDALLVARTAEKQEMASYMFGHMHNYLSSLYSFNEQVREKVNEVQDRDITKSDFISGTSQYNAKLAFIRGLRHDIQHGDFRSINLKEKNSAGIFKIYAIQFQEDEFVNTVRHPHDYLQHTHAEDRKYPLPYIARFHRGYFNEFTEDCLGWLERES